MRRFLRTENPDFQKWSESSQEFIYRDFPIRYWDEGSGDVVLLIHGFPTASWDWHLVWNELTTRHRVVAADMIGFGFSAKPKSYSYSIFDQAYLFEALCSELGVDTVSILTHDYGNTVTQELLARQNDRPAGGQQGLGIERICYLNGGLFPESHQPLLIQQLLIGPLGGIVARIMSKRRFEENLKSIFGPETQPSQDSLDQFWSLIEHHDQRAIMHKLARCQHRTRWVGAMERTEIPQRFVVGMRDPISGANMAARYRELIKNPDIIELEDIGHWPQIEAPELVLQPFHEFLKQNGVE